MIDYRFLKKILISSFRTAPSFEALRGSAVLDGARERSEGIGGNDSPEMANSQK